MNNNIIKAPVLLGLDPWLVFFKNWLRQMEGFSSTPYLDSGDLPTIGTGITFYPDGRKVTLLDKNITRDEDWVMLDTILKPRITTVNTIVVSPISSQRRIALLDFVYNCGETSFVESTLLKKINNNPDDPSIRDEMMKWVYCNGQILKGLVRRRKLEADLYFDI
jgi:lysozyme